MTYFTPYSALLGGIIIGGCAVLLLLSLGKILGLSGMFHQSLRLQFGEGHWRIALLLGLVMGGFIAALVSEVPFRDMKMDPFRIVLAGFLVGLGTHIGSGCTSGHGVCGLGRRSFRSIIAVCIFMTTAIVIVSAERFFF